MKSIPTIGLLTLFAASVALAGGGKTGLRYASTTKSPQDIIEKKSTGPTIPGDTVEKRVEKLTDKIHWCSSLDDAKAQAQNQHKLIFWLHALGDEDGAT